MTFKAIKVFTESEEAAVRLNLMTAIDDMAPLHKIMRLYVDYVLVHMKGNKLHTAKKMRIDRRTIQRWEKPSVSTTNTPVIAEQ